MMRNRYIMQKRPQKVIKLHSDTIFLNATHQQQQTKAETFSPLIPIYCFAETRCYLLPKVKKKWAS